MDGFNIVESDGLNVFVKIGVPPEVNLNCFLLILIPLIAL